MKIKYIIYYTCLISLQLVFGCKKGFLDTTPTNVYTDDTFWQTQEHAIAAINGTYAAMLDGALFGGSEGLITLDNATPNAYNYVNTNGINILAQGAQDGSNSGIINNKWNADYRGIGRANNVIARVPAINMDAALRDRIVAEAKFLRAVYYADMVNHYGGVPLITDAPDASQATLPRNSRAQVITQILKDLDEAAAVLPPNYTGVDVGRATKGAALGLKARVLLYESRWPEAAAAAKAVMDLNRYTLFPDYRALFYLENEANSEVIFDVQFKQPETGTSFDIGLTTYNNLAPLPDLVNSYLMADGKPSALSPLYNPASPLLNRDPRFYKTITYAGATVKGAIVLDKDYPQTGYGFKKYTIYKDDVKPAALITDLKSEINYMFIRYADVLLMYAEAQNEAVGPDASVYTALHLIRLRAGMPDVDAGLSQTAMRAVIRLERRIELAGEGLYYNDIRRWKTAETVMNADIFHRNGTKLGARKFNPARDYLWPIPVVARQNNTNLEQNPEYN
ncbi:SusD family protein [compost metagenome]